MSDPNAIDKGFTISHKRCKHSWQNGKCEKCGRDRKPRRDWNVIMVRAREAINKRVSDGLRPAVRSIFYILMSLGLIGGTKSDYGYLDRLLTDQRTRGQLPWGIMALDTGRAPTEGDNKYQSSEEFFKDIIEYLKDAHKYFKLPLWHNQPKQVIIIVEKLGLRDLIESFVDDLNIKVFACKGYQSWEDMAEARNHVESNKSLHIFYLGDFDPSGQNIAHHVLDQLKFFFHNRFTFKVLAVTKEQIEKYKLPHAPEDEEEIEKMRRDPRFRTWPYGLYRVELDALDAYAHDEFRDLIRNAVLQHLDKDILKQRNKEQEKLKVEVRKKVEDFMNGNGKENKR